MAIRFCVDCGHRSVVERKHRDVNVCMHEVARHLVTGEPTECVSHRLPSGFCGPEGVFFVGKPADGLGLDEAHESPPLRYGVQEGYK
jgi:hypothetical protein